MVDQIRDAVDSGGVKMRLDDGQIEVVDDMMAEIYREKTSFERLQIAFGLWRSAKIELFNCLRSLHPDWDEGQIQREVVRRISHGAIGSDILDDS